MKRDDIERSNVPAHESADKIKGLFHLSFMFQSSFYQILVSKEMKSWPREIQIVHRDEFGRELGQVSEIKDELKMKR